jgi:LmbE family N-acetylglucosaminyl deacetylase
MPSTNWISRRQLLRSTAGAALLGVTANAQQAPERRRLKVIITGAHPGDPEYGCGGTACRYSDQGHAVTLLYLNHGEFGCPDLAPEHGSAIRTAEADRACEILKARPLFTTQCDGNAIVDPSHYEEFRKMIEAEQPDVLFAHWPIDGHADHRAMSNLAYHAWLRLKKKFAFYYYEVSTGEDTLMFTPTDFVDITATEPRKRAACYAHASQTPDRYYALQTQVSRFRGIESGHTHAEAFVRHAQSPPHQLP